MRIITIAVQCGVVLTEYTHHHACTKRTFRRRHYDGIIIIWYFTCHVINIYYDWILKQRNYNSGEVSSRRGRYK